LSKVLWMSDAGCTTGFGRVTHSIGERLVEEYGHEVHVLAVNYRGDTWNCERPGHDHVTPLRLYRPNSIRTDDIYGMTRVIEMLGKVEPDVVVMLFDPQVIINHLFKNQYDQDKILLQYRPLLTYIPVDGINLPRTWTKVIPEVSNVVAMSRFGQEAYKPSRLVYHGVDPELWWPIWEKPKVTSTGVVCKTKADCKRAVGVAPDRFLVGRTDTNSARKDYPNLVKALWPLMKKNWEVEAWFHCEAETVRDNGVRFPQFLLRESNTVKPERFRFPGLHNSFEGWKQQDLNVLMSAFDVYASTSRGEGFGLTLAEAAACGIPIVAQNVSAIPEVVGPGGILLEPKDTFTVPSGEDVWLPDPPAFTEAIERLYHSKGLRRDLGMAGVEHVRKSFSWDFAAQKFDEYITALEHYEPPVTSTEASEASA
jgi:glycosyltransferase involved in cell wall biosynthesis